MKQAMTLPSHALQHTPTLGASTGSPRHHKNAPVSLLEERVSAASAGIRCQASGSVPVSEFDDAEKCRNGMSAHAAGSDPALMKTYHFSASLPIHKMHYWNHHRHTSFSTMHCTVTREVQFAVCRKSNYPLTSSTPAAPGELYPAVFHCPQEVQAYPSGCCD